MTDDVDEPAVEIELVQLGGEDLTIELEEGETREFPMGTRMIRVRALERAGGDNE